MILTEYKEYMRTFFEQYYEKLSRDGIEIKRPLSEKEREMWADDADPDVEWKKWKLVPANIEEGEIAEFEQEIGVKLPLSMKAFLTTYHHFFDDPIGVNPFSKHFKGMKNAWNPVLIKCGYLPFAWNEEHYNIRCMKLANMPAEEECGIYQIDHEVLFDFDEETVTPEEMDENMEFLSENLLTYLDEILNDKDKDSMHRALMNAVVAVLNDDFDIEDYDMLEMKLEEDYDSILEALMPVVEEYDLSEEDLEDILEEVEDWI
ncbi:MAG: SMI1/KNR4 family protein [Lachnospiraceae bacterium]|nr:SMI1/KNR4 family protein [Lachnospiraceae bacterium]